MFLIVQTVGVVDYVKKANYGFCLDSCSHGFTKCVLVPAKVVGLKRAKRALCNKCRQFKK